MHTPILILGGGTGGFAAALAIARTGGKCVVVEPTDWLGGQLTSQAVPPDDNRWVDGIEPSAPGFFGGTASYLAFRAEVRQWYRDHRPLTPAARANARLNPGNAWVAPLCYEPAVGHAVLQATLAPHLAAGRVQVIYRSEPVAADVDGDDVRAVTIRHFETGDETTITADYFLDGTELGDLFPLAGIEYAVGSEHTSDYGELHARTDFAEKEDVQAISWCFALEHRLGEDHTIERPANYAWWREYVPQLASLDHAKRAPSVHPLCESGDETLRVAGAPQVPSAWPGPLLDWTVVGGDKHLPRLFAWKPPPQQPDPGEMEMWRYRRIRDASLYTEDEREKFPDVALINMVQMDYFQKSIIDLPPAEKAAALEQSREQSLAFLYWMQTEAPRFDGSDGLGFPGLKLRGEELGTSDGFAKAPYIRESRRLVALTVVHEGHVGTEQRKAEGKPQSETVPFGLAEPFPDSVGIGHYRLDLHPSSAMRASIYVHSAPFRIPMGALIPRRVKNVLAAAKNLGVTHITNGCYRLHPVEWNTGESAGLLAQFCLSEKTTPHAVHGDAAKVRAFQRVCVDQGIPLAWPWETDSLSL